MESRKLSPPPPDFDDDAPELTDEEISRVLGQADIGKLRHWPWGSRDDDPEYRGCGCVAGAALSLGAVSTSQVRFVAPEAAVISDAVRVFAPGYPFANEYTATTPDGVLRMLEKAGLA